MDESTSRFRLGPLESPRVQVSIFFDTCSECWNAGITSTYFSEKKDSTHLNSILVPISIHSGSSSQEGNPCKNITQKILRVSLHHAKHCKTTNRIEDKFEAASFAVPLLKFLIGLSAGSAAVLTRPASAVTSPCAMQCCVHGAPCRLKSAI